MPDTPTPEIKASDPEMQKLIGAAVRWNMAQGTPAAYRERARQRKWHRRLRRFVARRLSSLTWGDSK